MASCSIEKKRDSNKLSGLYHEKFYGIPFEKKPQLIDSVLDQAGYDGVQLKVYELNFNNFDSSVFKSLTSDKFHRLPFKPTEMNTIPVLLEKYLTFTDTGYYSFNQSSLDGVRFLIWNISKHKFIIYDVGFLEELMNEDKKNGIYPR